ncbi:MAG: DUF2064 domain-containing protein [Phycisphaerales bacterium]|nr:DUF2064 domain-containing protein [Phycisphaerae bacterium]NNM24740.1 DUF2064 domain-containing protein [Phycisphaerales bacterium]
MAKRPVPGRVKTRLVKSGHLTADEAASLAAAMLECTVRRLATRMEVVIALADHADATLPAWGQRRTIDQGGGDLGARLDRVWRSLDPTPVVAFFGADSPDVPDAMLDAIPLALAAAPIAIGPAGDGGYWTLAARGYHPEVLRRIDWGGPAVYDQTRQRARDADLAVCRLPSWSDVDDAADLRALRRRLAGLASPAPPLVDLAGRLPAERGTRPAGEGRSMTDMRGARLVDEPASIELPDLSDTSILIVDDNAQNLELMHAYLEELPCRIVTATDGIEAVSAIEKDPPDLVLLDVMMPRMSGFEVCQKIKASPRTRDVIVIMVTALHEVGDFERAVESGTDDFLTKPVNKLELTTRVKSLLRVALLKRKLDQVMALKQRVAPDDRSDQDLAQKLEGRADEGER